MFWYSHLLKNFPQFIVIHMVKAFGGVKIFRRNINNLRYTDDTTLVAESKEELKDLLIKVEEEGAKAS